MKYLKSLIITGVLVLFTGFAFGQGMHGQNQGNTGQTGMMGMHGGQGMMSMMHGGQGMMGGGMMQGGMMQGGMMGMSIPSVWTILQQGAQLNLTQEQQTQLQELSFTVQQDMIDLRANLQQQQLELHQVLVSDNPQQNELRQIITAKSSVQADIQQRQLESFFEARDVLTAEQRNSLNLMPMGAGMMGGMNHLMHQPNRQQNPQGMMNMMNNNNTSN